MVHGYRTLSHWDQWLAQQFLGKYLLEEEKQSLSFILRRCFGKHALLIGVPHQADLLKATTIPCQTLMSPIIHHEKKLHYIEGDFHELPILTGGIDLVILPHTLEFIDNPRRLLGEACRIVKPEGLIVIAGFNPYSFWGIKKSLNKHKIAPWTAHFIHSRKIKHWLQLADFSLESHQEFLFGSRIRSEKLYNKLQFFELIGKKCFPFFGGAYVLLARAKVIPLTPIRLKWKQQLDSIRISTSTGYIARQSK